MKPAGWMVGASVVSWLIIARVAGAGANPELLCGMLGPLAVAALSWIVIERTCPVESRTADRRDGAGTRDQGGVFRRA